jgi:hypothetical protein
MRHHNEQLIEEYEEEYAVALKAENVMILNPQKKSRRR